MEVTVERLGPCEAKVTFTVPGEEYQSTLRRGLQNAGRNANMKGFRPGKVPIQILQKHLGPRIRLEAIEHFVRQAYDKAVEDHALKIVGFQRVDAERIQVEEGQPLTHAFEVSLRPEIELGTYEGLEVESQLEPVMDQEVEAAIENARLQQAHPEPAGADGLSDPGFALAKIEWVVDGEVVLQRDGLRLAVDSVPPGVEPQAYQAALAGAQEGATRELALTIPPDFDREDLRGKTGTCRIEIGQVLRMVPPTDEQLFQTLGVADRAALETLVREKLSEAKTAQENTRVENALIERLLDQHAFELPQRMVEDQTNARLAQLRRELQGAGTPPERIEEQVETQREAAHKAAVRGMRALFLLQAIGEAQKLLVSREDMHKEVEAIAQRNQATVQEVAEYYQKNNLFDQMAIELLERKVRRFLRDSARIREPA